MGFPCPLGRGPTAGPCVGFSGSKGPSGHCSSSLCGHLTLMTWRRTSFPPAHVFFNLSPFHFLGTVPFPEDRLPENAQAHSLPGWRVDGFIMRKWDHVPNF